MCFSFNLCPEIHLWFCMELKIVAFSCCIPYLFFPFCVCVCVCVYIYLYIYIYTQFIPWTRHISPFTESYLMYFDKILWLHKALIQILLHIFLGNLYVWCCYILSLKKWINWNIWSFCAYCYYWYIWISTIILFCTLFSHLFCVSFVIFSCFLLDWQNIFSYFMSPIYWEIKLDIGILIGSPNHFSLHT